MVDITAPTLLQVSPSDNATGVSVTSNLRLGFSEAVNATSGLIKIYKSDGTLFYTIAANDTSQVSFDSTKTKVTIDPSVSLLAGTSYYVIIETGAFEDIAGNDYAGFSSPTALNFTTAGTPPPPPPPSDTTAPLLTGTTPNDNASNVAVGANLVLTFNEAVKAGSGNFEIHNAANGSVVQSIAVTDAAKVNFSGSQVTINPGSDLSPGTSYYVTFASGVVLDVANNAFAGISSSTTFNFSTASPSGPPVLMSMIPADNGTGVQPWSDIVLFFNKEVKPGSGNIEIHKSDGSLITSIAITDTFQVSFADHVVTLDPHVDLDWSTGYYVTYGAGVIRDLQNNAAAGVTTPTQFNFTTGPNNADPGPLLVSASPSDNATNVNVGSNIVLTFNEPIKLGNYNGTIRVYYADGTNVKFIYLDDASQVSISGNTLTVNPTTDLLSQTAYYVTMLPGNILDLSGNAFAGITSPTTLNFVTGTTTDAAAPLLASTLPTDNAQNVARESSLILYFNEGVKAGSGNVEIHRVSDGSLVDTIAITNPVGITFYEDRVGVFPTVMLDWSTQYYVTMAPGVIKDYAGNNFAGISSSTAFNFTTIADPAISPPILIASYPYSSGTYIDANINLIFSELVQAGTGTIEIRRSSDGALATSVDIHDAGQVTIYQQSVTLNPDINLDPYTGYYVLISSGAIRDLAGNDYTGISSPTVVQFTTGALVPPPPPPPDGGVIVIGGFPPPDTTDPSLTEITPADNASNVPIAANLILTFNESVQAGSGDLEIRKSSDGSLFKSIALSDTSQVQFSDSTITINPNVNLGLNTGYYVVLDSGAVVDLAGNTYAGFSSPAGFNFTTASTPDTTPPHLTFSFHLSFDFDETVVRGTGNIEIRRLLDGSLYDSVAVTDISKVSINGDQVGVTPSIPLEDAAAYYVTIAPGVFKDLAGNAFGGTTTSYFTTGDQNAPVLLNMTPGIDATNVAVDANIVLTFNEPVQPGWNSFSLRILGQPSLNFDVNDMTQVTYAGNTVTINPTAILAAGTTYIFDIGTYAVKDLNGNGYYSQTYNFTTATAGGGGSPPGGLTLMGTIASNTLVGGAGDDVITGLGRGDTLTGGGGADTFVYTAVSDSTSRAYDTITDFNASADLIDLWFQVTGVDTAITSGSLSQWTMDSNLASAVGAAKLASHHAVSFTPNAGTLSGKTFLIVDANGVAGYQANADLVILLGNTSSLAGLTPADFV
jgi:methionine-rich copper-binding protein CopC